MPGMVTLMFLESSLLAELKGWGLESNLTPVKSRTLDTMTAGSVSLAKERTDTLVLLEERDHFGSDSGKINNGFLLVQIEKEISLDG